jgi:hypothetical protein
MSSSLTEDYLRWLAPQVRDTHDDRVNPYGDLLRIMFEKEFVWQVAYDDNRRADGLDLRVEFCHQADIYPQVKREFGAFLDQDHPNPPCSFLEVLIGLSRRLAFNAGGFAEGWAWRLVENLELHRMRDPLGRRNVRKVHDILDACIWRTYEPNGQGGFFPLAWPEEDQRQVELWYQMAAFISELHPEH